MRFDPYSLTIGFILGAFFVLMLMEPSKKGEDDSSNDEGEA